MGRNGLSIFVHSCLGVGSDTLTHQAKPLLWFMAPHAAGTPTRPVSVSCWPPSKDTDQACPARVSVLSCLPHPPWCRGPSVPVAAEAALRPVCGHPGGHRLSLACSRLQCGHISTGDCTGPGNLGKGKATTVFCRPSAPGWTASPKVKAPLETKHEAFHGDRVIADVMSQDEVILE